MRVGYLRSMRPGAPAPTIPLTKQKVRQAIFHAIDRKAIAEKLVTAAPACRRRHASRRSSAATPKPRCVTPMIRRRRSASR